MNPTHTSAKSMRGGVTLPLLALATGAFGTGTTESSPMGLPPVITDSVYVSIPQASMLISVYAIGAMMGALIMTLLLTHWPRRRALIALMNIFTIDNLLSALMSDYTTLLLARLITSLNHSIFFGPGSMVAASLAPREKQASAVTAMFMGLTIVNVDGIPAVAWFGQVIGWHISSAATVSPGLIAITGLFTALPKDDIDKIPNLCVELVVLTRPVVLGTLATAVLSAGAMFTLYTRAAPTFTQLTDASSAFVMAMLVLIGIGSSIGNIAGGRLVDRSLGGNLIGFLVLLIVTMLVLPVLTKTHVGITAALLAWGITTFTVVPPLQMRMMRATAETPGPTSSVNVGAFNLGNALGAAAGGAAISVGLGYATVPIVDVVTTATGLTLVGLHVVQCRVRFAMNP